MAAPVEQLGGFKFRRQAVIVPHIADFLCPEKALVIEVDGDTHDGPADERRDAFLAAKGYHVLRFTNHDMMANVTGVLEAILTAVTALPPRRPHPNPSLQGEGLQQPQPEAPPLEGRGWGGGRRRARRTSS